MTSTDLNNTLKNPIHDFLSTGETTSYTITNKLEREYTVNRPPNYTNHFVNYPGESDVVKYIDHNKYLALYPDYEYLYGPYTDSNKVEFNKVFILFRKVGTLNKVKVVYATRVFEELKTNSLLPTIFDINSYPTYDVYLGSFKEVVNPSLLRAFYMEYTLTQEDRIKILELYKGYTYISPLRYNKRKNCYNLNISTANHDIVKTGKGNLWLTLNKVLYEIKVLGRRLSDTESVRTINSKSGDITLSNLTHMDREENKLSLKETMLIDYKLDIEKLEQLYANNEFNRFRGLYTYNGKNISKGLFGRRYIKLVKNGTDVQIGILLCRVLMEVYIGRILNSDETVDHINHDKTDDRIENLRVIPRSQHASEDAVRVEIDPTNCAICNTKFIPTPKALSYYKTAKNNLVCSPGCLSKLRDVQSGKIDIPLTQQDITYRYYVVGKTSQEKRYLEGTDYKACRASLNTTDRELDV